MFREDDLNSRFLQFKKFEILILINKILLFAEVFK